MGETKKVGKKPSVKLKDKKTLYRIFSKRKIRLFEKWEHLNLFLSSLASAMGEN